ncbi:hypothetical protein C0991_011358 [Blastosporella zonata]|nr:hypothetical protein C0991_011358 [Blastosporella zonata]
MEVPRKRPHVDDEDATAVKKRVLTGPNGSPQVNGMAKDKEDMDSDNLELFRKEAIYRRMKQYSRENERFQSRIEDLEKRKLSCEAGLAAMTACWNQLVNTIRLFVKAEELPQVADEMFDFTLHIREDDSPDFEKTLKDNMDVTQTLVTHLVKAGESSQAHLSNASTIWDRQKEMAERVSLKSQLDLVQSNLRDAQEQKEQYRKDLQTVENRLDRLRSKTVSAMQSHTPEQRLTEEAIEESQRKPSSPAGSKSPVQSNGIGDPTEADILRAQIAARESKIGDLEREASLLRQQNTTLENELKQISFEKIVENPHYKHLCEHAGFLQAAVTESHTQTTRMSEELANLQATRAEWEATVLSAANQANQELRTMIGKRDAENVRLREQREQQAAELLERKQQDSVKLASQRETKALNESRLERIAALESEVARTKARLAADAGDDDLMKFFLAGQTEETKYFESLKERVSAAEQRASILEQALSRYQEPHSDTLEHFKAETDALQKVAEIQAQLDKYKAVYGNTSAHPPDTATLLDQLRVKEEEVQKLRLQDIQHTQAETSLYAELEKLSTAWESLERQVKDKVFDLSNLEIQLKKATSDKAKSENKYYAAMRDKDAVSAETSKLQRNVEKQNQVIERLVDAEKSLSAQLGSLEKELTLLKNGSRVYKEKIETLTLNVAQWTTRCHAEKQRSNEARKLRDWENANTVKRTELRKLEDSLIRTKKELEVKAKQQEATVTESNSSEAEQLLKLLKCSICRKEFRSAVVTKCMHSKSSLTVSS